jgi:bifunctional non-homologous end joining protein LigD
VVKRLARDVTEAEIPSDVDDVTLELDSKRVSLTNLRKVYFPAAKLTKGDLLRYYLKVAPFLLPHVAGRAMVMKRYPHGINADFFYMKRTPSPHPEWLRTCPIEHRSGNVIDFPIIDDLASLLWLINLGCIDLNPWYSLCNDPNRPLYIHFDMDPVEGTAFSVVREGALVVRDVLAGMRMTPFVKTSGSSGVHIYVAIEVGPAQHDVWEIAKAIGHQIAKAHPDILTAEYKIAKRPKGRVLVDYNQNAFGKTLASIYSVRPNEDAAVSTPVTWEELEAGCEPGDFTMRNVPQRLEKVGDLWKPLLSKSGRFKLHAAV